MVGGGALLPPGRRAAEPSAGKPDLCLKHFDFLAHQLLPSFVQVPAEDATVKSQCETTIVTGVGVRKAASGSGEL